MRLVDADEIQKRLEGSKSACTLNGGDTPSEHRKGYLEGLQSALNVLWGAVTIPATDPEAETHRRELAASILQELVAAAALEPAPMHRVMTLAELAVTYADALIERLRKPR